MSSPPEITRLLIAWCDGDKTALDTLLPLVEKELHRLAKHYMRRESPGHTLQTTALVNEAYLRLVERKNVRWQNRAHFFGIAAQLMRRILLNHARDRHRAKRGGQAIQVSLSEVAVMSDVKSSELLALDEALEGLAAIDKRKSQVVELRYFGGLSVEETAEVMKVSTITVIRHIKRTNFAVIFVAVGTTAATTLIGGDDVSACSSLHCRRTFRRSSTLSDYR